MQRTLIRHDPRHGAALGQDIELSQAILADTDDGWRSNQRPFLLFKSQAVIEAETSDKAGAEICIEIGPLASRYRRATINIVSGNVAVSHVVRTPNRRQRVCSTIAVGGWVNVN